jgi:hypothetical protein
LSCASTKSPSIEQSPETSENSSQTAPKKSSDEHAGASFLGSSWSHPVEGKSAYLPFNDHHLELTLRARQLSSNTSALGSTLPQIVAAPPGSNKEQPANPETAQVQERAPHSAQRTSLAVPRVSVKSRIAAFEKKSPTASTFGPSPPQEGKVDTASRSFSINPEKQESRTLANIITQDFAVTHIDLSQTNSPGGAQSIQEEVRSAPRSGFGVSSRLSLESVRRSIPNSETAKILPIPLTFIRQNYKPLRAPPKPPFPPTTNSLQAPLDSSETELSLVATSALDSSKLPEQPSTPRLGRASLALTTVSKGARKEVALSEKSSLPTSLQIPSFGRRFPPKSLLERVKHNELPGPRPRQEHALERRSRVKPHSRLSQVLCAESPGKEYPAPPPTESSLFEDNKRRHSFSAPEDHSNFRRSSSPCRNRLATLRSLEDLGILEEQAAYSEACESSLGDELGRSTGRFSQIALVPKPLKSQRNAAGGAEAKGLDAQDSSTSTGAGTDRQNASNFNFPFDHPKGIGTGIPEEVQCKRTLLPSILPRPGYSSPPNTPELLESEARDYNFSIPTFKEVSVLDFERPSRRAVLSLASLIRGSGEPASTRPCCKAPFLEHPQQLLPSGPSRTRWPSITEEQPGYLIAPPKDTILPILRIENLPNHQQIEGRDFDREGTAHYLDLGRSTRFPSDFSRESSESPTINPANAGGQFSGTPLPREPEEITTHITRTLIQRHLGLSESESITGPDIMNRLRPESALAVSHHRREAMRLAKAQETMVIEKCRRSGASIPEYAFDELIGKGSFGRVYKW